MSVITTSHTLVPTALERFLDGLGKDFGDGLTLYVTATSLDNSLALVPPREGRDLAGLASIAERVVSSETGAVFFSGQGINHVVVPPFPILQDEIHTGFAPTTLLRLVYHPHLVGLVLLRLGSYSLGVFRGNNLLASKTDTRYVKGRHRAGGSSAGRFQRVREKQVQELFVKVCSVVQRTLMPYQDNLDYILFGGERHVLQAFRQRCPYLARFADRTLQRILPVHEPRRAELEQMIREVWKSQVLTMREEY